MAVLSPRAATKGLSVVSFSSCIIISFNFHSSRQPCWWRHIHSSVDCLNDWSEVKVFWIRLCNLLAIPCVNVIWILQLWLNPSRFPNKFLPAGWKSTQIQMTIIPIRNTALSSDLIPSGAYSSSPDWHSRRLEKKVFRWQSPIPPYHGNLSQLTLLQILCVGLRPKQGRDSEADP